MNRPPSIAYAAVGAWIAALVFLLISNLGTVATVKGCVANTLIIVTIAGLWKFCRWLRRKQVEGGNPPLTKEQRLCIVMRARQIGRSSGEDAAFFRGAQAEEEKLTPNPGHPTKNHGKH